jgi:hypothetical protein
MDGWVVWNQVEALSRLRQRHERRREAPEERHEEQEADHDHEAVEQEAAGDLAGPSARDDRRPGTHRDLAAGRELLDRREVRRLGFAPGHQ